MKEELSFQDIAYNRIEQMILRSELKPGERIDKNQLEVDLKLKLAPIRQAIAMLGRVNLINIYAQSGSYVSKINVKSIYQAYTVRKSLEQLVVGRLIPKVTADMISDLKKIINLQRVYIEAQDYDGFFDVDDQFHHYLYTATDNEFIWNWLQEINLQFNRLRYLKVELQMSQWSQLTEEHEAIIRCIENGDAVTAKIAISQHLDSVKKDVDSIQSVYPEYFE